MRDSTSLLGNKKVIFSLLISLYCIPTPSWAQDAAQSSPPSAENSSLDQIIIVEGKRRKKELTSLDSTAPVDIVGADTLKTSGSDNLIDALQRLLPSVNIPLGAANTVQSSRVAKSVSLHGLGPDETLILIDGQRLHISALPNTGFVFGRGSEPADLNSIPLSAIDHIEVLEDGATAQYGSDAIGGVVNIVLKKGQSGRRLFGYRRRLCGQQ